MLSPTRRKERLEQAVRVLSELPRAGRVDMELWRTCQTVACVGGWIGQDPWFTRRGLRLDRDSVPTFRNLSHYNALQIFLGLTQQETRYLFSPRGYSRIQRKSKHSVISRFKRFVKDGKTNSRTYSH